MKSKDKEISKKIIAYCKKVQKFTRYVTFDDFMENDEKSLAVAMCIAQIAELSKILSQGFKEVFHDFPWKEIIATRNVIVHKYGDLHWQTIWQVITEEIPILIDGFENALIELEKMEDVE